MSDLIVRLPGSRPLIERLGARDDRDPTREAVADRALMILAGAYLCVAGALLTLLWLALPYSPAPADKPGMVAIAGVELALAAVLLIASDRLPSWSFHVFTAVMTCVITATVHLSGADTSPYAFFYLWIALYALYFFSVSRAAAHVIFIAIAYAAVVVHDVAQHRSSDLVVAAGQAAPRWTLTVGTLVVAVALLGLLKERLDHLIAQLAEAAREDPLTRLRNRRGFDELFDLEVERSQRTGRALSVLIGDLDHFKHVNDRFGHPVGDEALVRAGAVLERTKRRIDYVARFGGEEFAIVLPDSDEHAAYILAERLRRAVREAFAEDPVTLTISFGIASFPHHGATPEALVSCADQALYTAKELGRDCTVIYSPEAAAPLATEVRQRHARGEARLASLITLAETLDTLEQSAAVGRYAAAIGRGLGLPPTTLKQLGVAGVLHDVGKVGIAHTIVAKPGPLDDEEWLEMRKHPEIGARMLEGAGLPPEMAEWVRDHHERPDGHGYPGARAWEELSLEARILAVADAYEAMTNDRSYRPALGEQAAREELSRGAGTQFDPAVVEVFLRVLEGSEAGVPYSRARAT